MNGQICHAFVPNKYKLVSQISGMIRVYYTQYRAVRQKRQNYAKTR